jgi:flagellar biosynthesis/type III secretory pathway protein FliH
MVIIKNLLPITWDRVIPQENIDLVLNLQEQAKQIRHQNQECLAEATAAAAEIKHKAYTETAKQVIAENQQLLQELETKLDGLLHSLSDDLYELIYRIAAKLGLEKIGIESMQNLIKIELDKFTNIQRLSIFANPKVLEQLQQSAVIAIDCIEWHEASELHDFECICSTPLWTLRVDVVTALAQIKKILTMSTTGEK